MKMRLKRSITLLFTISGYLATLHMAMSQQEATREVVRVPLATTSVAVANRGDSDTAVFSGRGYSLAGKTGAPALPVLCVKVLLPPDTDLRTVAATIEDVATENLAGEYDIAPMPPAMCRGVPIIPDGLELKEGRSTAAYARDKYIPDKPLGLVLPGQMREWRFVEIEVRPYQYNPATKKLRKLAAGTLVVSFSRRRGEKIMRTRSQRMATLIERDIKSSVVNFTEASAAYREARRLKNPE